MNTQLPFTAEKPIFMKMAEVANFPQMTVEQQQLYMRSLNHYRTVLATKDYDLNRGIAIGRAEGRAEERMTIARTLLNMGMTIEQVAQATNLTIDQIKESI